MAYNFIIHLVIVIAASVQLHSNYNYSQVHDQALLSQPLLLAHRIPNLSKRALLIQHFPIRKYELKDTGYQIDDSLLSPFQHQLIYQMDPPLGIFAFEVMSIENYHLLEIRHFQFAISNPSRRFKLCVGEIVIDSEEIKRNDDRGNLPLCINPAQTVPFNFSLYVSAASPTLVKVTIYFLVEIYDGKALVEEKAYARKVYATVTPNHLRLQTSNFKKCPANQVLVIHNYQPYEIGMMIESRKRFQTAGGETIQGEIRLRPSKEIHLLIEGKPVQMVVHSYGVAEMKGLPDLLLKTNCEEPLTVDYQNIGIITEERMVLDLPLTVTSKWHENITILEVQIEATTETVELQQRAQAESVILAQARGVPVALMRIHSSKSPQRRATITIKIRYQASGEEKSAVQKLVYTQIRNAISAGQKKYIDVTKPMLSSKHLQSRFPIKNNLNVPIYLNRISLDQSIFQLTWQVDRRRFIYPNHSVQEFSLVYIGSLNLPLSSLKYLLILEFNGHILVPLEITIYDHTLQCLYNNIVHKCAALPPLDFGYFRDGTAKSKQLVVRNWNPEQKQVYLAINQTQASLIGYNASLRVYRPGAGGQHEMRQSKSPLQLMLKSQQFLLLNIELQPFDNATSGKITLELKTSSEAVASQLTARFENGTIALIPQTIRFINTYNRQIQYINLVSTYSQQYNILSVTTNLTGLTVHYNQPPAILENQWVGMSLVYDPFPDDRNLTDQIWSSSALQFKYLHHRIDKGYQRIKHARVRLTTTTDLEANSTAIIEEKFPQVFVDAMPSKEIQGVYEIEKQLLKRRKRSNKRDQRNSGEIKLTIENPLDTPIKYMVHLLSQPKFRDIQKTLRNYQAAIHAQMQQGFFCISQDLRSKYSITPATIKTMFRLDKPPQQCTVQLFNHQIIVIGSHKQTVHVNSNMTLLYLAKSYRNLCRVCFRFTQRTYINRLVFSELANKALHEEGLTALTEFLKAELNHLEDPQVFELEYLDAYARIKEDFNKFCEKYPDVMVFRFCHFLNSRLINIAETSNKSILPLANEKAVILAPGQTHRLTFSVTFATGRDKVELYLIFANNYTQFETYRLIIHLQDPKIRVLPKLSKFELQLPIKEETWSKKRAAELEVMLLRADYREQDSVIQGERSFEIINQGTIEVNIAHLGIEDKQITCSYGEIWINGLTCFDNQPRNSDWAARAPKYSPLVNRPQQLSPFTLNPGQRYNLTIHFQFHLPQPQFFRTTYFPIYPQQIDYFIYIYDQRGHFFKLDLSFKVGDRELKSKLEKQATKDLRRPMVNYHTLNVVSLVIICLILLRLRSQDGGFKKRPEIQEERESVDRYSRLYRMKKLSKIIRESTYSDSDSSIGLRVVKRPAEKPVHNISEDLLLSVRQVKQRQLKKYFNESQQSQIGAIIGFNHHLSLSHSMSYEQEEHENRQHQNQPQELIELAASPRIGEESQGQENNEEIQEIQDIEKIENMDNMESRQGEENTDNMEYTDNMENTENEPSQSSSSNLPQGEQVKLTDEIDADSSWFDFNQENSFIANKSVNTVLGEENQFYNVFRSEISLRKQSQGNHSSKRHRKRD